MSQSTKQGNVFDLGLMRRLLGQVGEYKVPFYLTGFLVLFLAATIWVRPALISYAIDAKVKGINPNELGSFGKWVDGWVSAYAPSPGEGLLLVSLIVVVLLLVEAVLQFYQTYLANLVAQSVTLDMRSKLYKHIMSFRLHYFDKHPVGSFVTRLVSDIDGIAQIFSDGILSIIGDILKLAVVIGVMFYIDWKLTLVVLIPIPLLLFATRIFQKSIKKAFIQVRNEVNRINVFIQEHVTGMNIVQIFHREAREQEKFKVINKEHRDANIRSVWAFSIFFPLVELFSAASVALLLWWGVHESVEGKMTLGVILEFILYVFMLYRPIRQLADRFNVFQMGIVNAERVFGVFDTVDQIHDEGTQTLQQLKGDIVFDRVWFAYNQEDWVIKDVSFQVKPGETVAFVGSTGAGKSTIINLLSRFYDFQKGQITIDGTALKTFSLESLRKNVAVVLQDVFLFSDTIFNNITLYDQSISREQVIEASKAVGAHDFIMKLPGGYDYDVRERGGMLSAGQRQLLAFIRAYVYQPKILVLDEATSSIDTESELLIQRATEKLTKGRTSIVIAHRLSTIRNADRIVVMDKGRIAEQGTHQELLSIEGGAYRRLFELQFAND